MSNFEPLFRVVSYLPAVFYSLITELIGWIVPREWIAKDVSNEIILITGAGSGLGRNMALEFAKLNASLVLWDINEKGLQETKTMIDREHKQISRTSNAGKRFCLTYRVDVSDRTQVQEEGKKVFEDINENRPAGEEERYVSVLVNNAGIYHGLYLQDLKDEQIERIFKINILSHFWTVRTFLPNMMKHKKGHIVEIASLAGYAGLLKQTDYCATKFATVGFEEALSIELDHLGYGDKIRTTSVCPFFFNSNLFDGYNSKATSTPIMSAEFVAKEAVLTMRCNQTRIMLPKASSYIGNIARVFMTRQAMILYTKALNLEEGIRNIKGHAAAQAS